MKSNKLSCSIAAIAIFSALTAAAILLSGSFDPVPESIDCVMNVKQLDSSTPGLLTGYHYELLKNYARDNGVDINIRLADSQENLADSLKSKVIDIAVIPASDSAYFGRCRIAHSVDSLVFWAVRPGNERWIQNINTWIDTQTGTEEFNVRREQFFTKLDPFKRKGGQSFISPYDTLIKAAADSLGWDWRMLAALIYQESHFKLDVKSNRGATGLMQMMPSSALSMGAGNPVDPQESILAGTGYILKLQKFFSDVPDEQERIKFILAAYNAGENRIQSCREYARGKELEGNTWDEIVSLIPEIEDFKGVETTAHVDAVLSTYREFCRICR